MMLDLRSIARALGGEVASGQVLAPGPGHSPSDRSMTVRLSASAPDGFLVFSHCGDDFRDCRDYVRERLGMDQDAWRKPQDERPVIVAGNFDKLAAAADNAAKTADALRIWEASKDPRGTLAQTYLASRGLEMPEEIAGDVLRWHPATGAVVALFRNLHTAEPQAITRIYLTREGRKIDRKFLGPVGGAAIMLDVFENVTFGLHVGEGVETCLAGRQLGFKPAWALGSADAILTLPMLACVDVLTVFAETDKTGANARAIDAVGARWVDAGREVLVVTPYSGGDMNDALRRRA